MVRLEFPVLQGAQSLSDGPTFSAFMPVVLVRWKVGQGEIVEFREIHLCALLCVLLVLDRMKSKKERIARDSNSQPENRHFLSKEAANHSLTIQTYLGDEVLENTSMVPK